MATRTISTKIAIEGEKQYKAALQDCASSLQLMKSQLALVESQFAGNANSMEALTAKGKALSDMYDAQKTKVKTMQDALENAKNAQNAHATASEEYKAKIAAAEKELDRLKNTSGDTAEEQKKLQDQIEKLNANLQESEAKEAAAEKGCNNWQKQLNYAQTDLNKLDGEISQNKTYLEEAKASADGCATSIDKYGKQTKQAAEESKDFGDKSKNAINTLQEVLASAGVAASVKEIAEAFYKCTSSAASFADNILTLSDQTGIGTKELQQYTYASELVDVSVEDLTKTMAKNIKSMSSARDGSAQVSEAYQKLGIKVQNTDGSLRDSKEVYWEIIDSLGKCTNETERDAIAMQLLGKSAQDLNPLIKAGSEKMRELGAEAESAGYIMSDSMLESCGALDDSFQRIKLNGTTLSNTIGEQLAPNMQGLTDAGNDALQWLIDFLQNNEEVIPVLATVAEGTGAFLAVVSGFLILQKVIPLVQTFTAALAANPYVLAAGAIVGLVVALVSYSKSINGVPEETQKFADSAKETADALEKYSAEVDQTKQINQQYSNSLYELSKKENKSAADKALMQQYVDSLNKSVPELALAYDEQTDSINKSKSATDNLISTKSKYDKYTDSITKLAQENANLEEIETKLKAAHDDLTAAQEKMAAGNRDIENLTGETYEKYRKASDEVNALQAAYDACARNVLVCKGNIASYSLSLEESNTSNFNNSETVKKLTEKIKSLQEEYGNVKKSSEESINSQISKWQELDNTVTTSTESLQNALDSQAEYYANYTDNFNSLTNRNIDGVQEFALELSDGSTESAAILAGMSGKTDEEVTNIINSWRRSREGKDALNQNVQEMEYNYKTSLINMVNASVQETIRMQDALKKRGEFEAIGSNDAEGYRQGLESKIPAIINTAQQMSWAASNSMKVTSQQRSPSRVYRSIAGMDAEGYIVGWEEKRKKINDQLKHTAEQNILTMSASAPKISDYMTNPNNVKQSVTNINNYNTGTSGTEDAGKIATALGNVQVVLNDGTLVGRLMPKIDASLGKYQSEKGRGM